MRTVVLRHFLTQIINIMDDIKDAFQKFNQIPDDQKKKMFEYL